MTFFANEKYRGYIDDKYNNDNNITCECVVPSSAEISEVFYVKELGIFQLY